MGKRLISHSPRVAQGLLVNSWILMTHCLFLLTKSRKKTQGRNQSRVGYLAAPDAAAGFSLDLGVMLQQIVDAVSLSDCNYG